MTRQADIRGNKSFISDHGTHLLTVFSSSDLKKTNDQDSWQQHNFPKAHTHLLNTNEQDSIDSSHQHKLPRAHTLTSYRQLTMTPQIFKSTQASQSTHSPLKDKRPRHHRHSHQHKLPRAHAHLLQLTMTPQIFKSTQASQSTHSPLKDKRPRHHRYSHQHKLPRAHTHLLQTTYHDTTDIQINTSFPEHTLTSYRQLTMTPQIFTSTQASQSTHSPPRWGTWATEQLSHSSPDSTPLPCYIQSTLPVHETVPAAWNHSGQQHNENNKIRMDSL